MVKRSPMEVFDSSGAPPFILFPFKFRTWLHELYPLAFFEAMKKLSFVFFVGYVWIKTLIGLTFHPYKSILETVRHPVLFPVIFSPFLGIIMLFIAAKIGSLLITVYGIQRELVAIFLSTTLISILFWQALLVYLLLSFLTSSWKNR